ncbi:MAG: BatA domain-containing protein [Flavobacteriaceae bacterium]
MQFKHPELLYALLLLLIPIIVHLFQLRRFQKIDFTNVAFLKSVTIQTRKSSQLKKWLTLITRLLLLAAIILAFAQPYFTKGDALKLKTETVIYLDNSFSMQAKGAQGELLKRAVQDILEANYDNKTVSIFTNNKTLKNSNSKTIRNELLQLDYSANQLDYNAVILKGKGLFSKDNSTQKNLLMVSDFQQLDNTFEIQADSSISINLLQLKPVNTNNVGIDSLYISKVNATNIELTINLNGTKAALENLPVSLFNGENLVAKSSVSNTNKTSTSFSIPNNAKINGKITIDDASLQFDNTLFFNINERSNINVLAINEADDNYLKRIFTDDEFALQSVAANQLNFNDISKQNLIVLNELKSIPISLSNALQSFTKNGGFVLIIPAIGADINSYNQGLSAISNASLSNETVSDKNITSINFSHPVFDAVFDKQISNFQYPIVHNFYTLNAPESAILNFEDNKPFLVQSENTYIFAASLNANNSNFMDSPLIVPTIYNIGRQSLKLPKLYYHIGETNTFDVNTTMPQDAILKLKHDDVEIIPQQQTFSNKVTITTNEAPELAQTYAIIKNNETIEHISYNYNRSESDLNYQDLSQIKNVRVSNSLPQLLTDIKSDNNNNALWKWFVIFALLFLIIEMLILKYFK